MRFDLTCNIVLESDLSEDRAQLCALPAVTSSQKVLNEVLWVAGCQRWFVSLQRSGQRVLELVKCAREVRIAIASCVSLAPRWLAADQIVVSAPTINQPQLNRYAMLSEHWAAERIRKGLIDVLGSTAMDFSALLRIFDWLRERFDARDLARYADSPAHWSLYAEDRVLGPLQFAVAAFRAIGFPTRVVAGFAPPSGLTYGRDPRVHCLEIYLDRRWWLFDVGGRSPSGLIRTATGWDAADLAILRHTATARLKSMEVNVDPPPAWDSSAEPSSLLVSLDGDDETESASGRPPRHEREISTLA